MQKIRHNGYRPIRQAQNAMTCLRISARFRPHGLSKIVVFNQSRKGRMSHSSNARPILEDIRYLFKAVMSPAGNENRPNIPVDNTKNKSAGCLAFLSDWIWGKSYSPPPTTAYVAYQKPTSPSPFFGGIKGATSRQELKAILSQMAVVHALKGLFKSGLDFRSHKVPILTAMTKDCPA
ncbi:MAG: hypothetical protein Q9167_002940 [Letrouitia subvulpina]